MKIATTPCRPTTPSAAVQPLPANVHSPHMLYQRFLSPRTDLMLMKQICEHLRQFDAVDQCGEYGNGARGLLPASELCREPAIWFPVTRRQHSGSAADRRARSDHRPGRFGHEYQSASSGDDPSKPDRSGRADIANLENATPFRTHPNRPIMATLQRINQACFCNCATSRTPTR